MIPKTNVLSTIYSKYTPCLFHIQLKLKLAETTKLVLSHHEEMLDSYCWTQRLFRNFTKLPQISNLSTGGSGITVLVTSCRLTNIQIQSVPPMRMKFLLLPLALLSSLLPASADERVGLPACRTSPYMGQPGDGIRSDLGNSIYGQRVVGSGMQQVGLPVCRNSVYMGQPGDGIRSDLGNKIQGGRPTNQAPRVGLPACRNSVYMGQPGDGIRSDLGRQISGQSLQRRVQSMRPAAPVNSYSYAYTYADYRH